MNETNLILILQTIRTHFIRTFPDILSRKTDNNKKILFDLKYKINFSTFVWKRVRSGLYCIGPSRERDDRQRRIGSGSPVSGTEEERKSFFLKKKKN